MREVLILGNGLLLGKIQKQISDYLWRMKKLTLKNLVWKEGKYFVAQCLNVDVSSFGKTKSEALKNLNEALDLFFEDEKTIHFTKVERPEIITARVRHA